jgi:signal transduction histidine kinase
MPRRGARQMSRTNHIHKTAANSAATWHHFTDAMLAFTMNRAHLESLSDILVRGLEVFLELPGADTVSLYLLDDESNDFHYSQSLPHKSESDAYRQYQVCIDRGAVAAALNSGQPSFLQPEGETNVGVETFIVPLVCPAGIVGIVIVSLEQGAEHIEQMLHRLSVLHAHQFASMIYSARLFRRLTHEQTALKQKIVARTQSLDNQLRETRLLWDALPVGIIVFDVATRRTIQSNAAALTLLGYSILQDIPYTYYMGEMEEKIFTGENNDYLERLFTGTFKKADGTLLPVEYRAQPAVVRDANCLVIIFQKGGETRIPVPSTGTVSAGSSWNAADRERIKVEKSRVLGILARRVAHDFSNVLNSISGFSHLIAKYNTDPEKVTKFNTTIGHSVRRGFELTNLLKNMTVDKKLHTTEVSIRELSDGFKTQTETEARVPATVVVTVEGGPHFIRANTQDAASVFHLVGKHICRMINAATDGSSDISVQSRVRKITIGNEIASELIAESNTGEAYIETGIQYDGERSIGGDMERFFDPNIDTAAAAKEAGLYLPSALALTLRYRGTIRVESDRDGSTIIKIYFPAA